MTEGAYTRAMRWTKGMMLKHMPLMITCVEFENFIDAYLEGELPDGKRRLFELHLKVCRECRDYLAAYRRTMMLGKTALSDDPAAMPPETVPEDLIKAVLDARDA